MNSKISEKDKKTWDEFLSSDQKLYDKDNLQTKANVKKTRSLDLHGKNLNEANQIIETFIKKSYEDKIQKLIIVTGKGCLLYTSPSPRDNRVSRMPSSA